MSALNIDLSKLNFAFRTRPLLIGGKAMEYYGLRKAGEDIDFVITAEDYAHLAQMYPEEDLKDLWGDLGVCVDEFEIVEEHLPVRLRLPFAGGHRIG